MAEDSNGTVSAVTQQFGVVIAFLLPGFILLWAVQIHSSVVRLWLQGAMNPGAAEGPTGGSFLLAAIASLALGMLVSGFRWIVYDCILFGWILQDVRPKRISFSALSKHLPAVSILIENHYRYFQYYANSSVALGVAGLISIRQLSILHGLLIVVIEVVMGAAARDSWNKYYDRLTMVLSPDTSREGRV
jgi:hypothetical protein